MRFLVTQQVPCYVIFHTEVEAENEESAKEAVLDGRGRAVGDGQISDAIDWVADGEMFVEIANEPVT